mgnify:FL=1
MTNFPFPPKAKASEATPETVAAPVAAAPAETTAVKSKGKKKSGEDRKKPAPAMTPEQVKQIISLVKDHSYTQIAEVVGVTKFQVNRVLMVTKDQLRKSAEGDAAKLAKVDAFIKEHLSRPEDSLPGKGPRGGKVKGALDDVVGDILASIGG